MDAHIQNRIRRNEASIYDLMRAGLWPKSPRPDIVIQWDVTTRADSFLSTAADWDLSPNTICEVDSWYYTLGANVSDYSYITERRLRLDYQFIAMSFRNLINGLGWV